VTVVDCLKTLTMLCETATDTAPLLSDVGRSVASHLVKLILVSPVYTSGLVAEWLACWTQAQKAWVHIATTTLSGNSLRQTVHNHRVSVHQAAKLVAAFLRVARVTAGLAESNGSLLLGL